MPIVPAVIDATLATPYGEAAYGVVEALQDAGFDAWWVGGAVRDMAMGAIPVDIDIGTDALPQQIAAVFPQAREATAGLGSMLVERKKRWTFEVTTFREDDQESDGRHPEAVVFSDRRRDAERRDFTVNALYFHPISREIFDPYDGLLDLRERLVRFIGSPAVRIRHDALRLLRAVRFRARIDGQYHPDTFAALKEHAALVETLSGTRQRTELEKMVLGPRADLALEDLRELGVLQYMLPELAACKGVAQPKDYHREGDVWEHTKQCIASCTPEDAIDLRLAALFHDCGKAVTFTIKERIRFDHHAEESARLAGVALDRLQFPAKRKEKICWLIAHHMMMTSFAQMPEDRKGHWYYHPWFTELLRLFAIDIAGTTPSDATLYDAIVRDYNAFLNRHPRPEKPLLHGEEIMEILGIAPGARVGEVLSLLRAQQDAKVITTKREAVAFVKSMR